MSQATLFRNVLWITLHESDEQLFPSVLLRTDEKRWRSGFPTSTVRSGGWDTTVVLVHCGKKIKIKEWKKKYGIRDEYAFKIKHCVPILLSTRAALTWGSRGGRAAHWRFHETPFPEFACIFLHIICNSFSLPFCWNFNQIAASTST